MIYRLVSGFISDKEIVNDIVQEVFIKLYLQLNSSIYIEFPKTWLYRVAINESLNFVNRKQNKISLETTIEITNDISDSIDKKIERAESRQQMLLALKHLKKSDRTLLILYSEGLSYKEISEISGLKFNSVGKSLTRALKKLKTILKDEKYEVYF